MTVYENHDSINLCWISESLHMYHAWPWPGFHFTRSETDLRRLESNMLSVASRTCITVKTRHDQAVGSSSWWPHSAGAHWDICSQAIGSWSRHHNHTLESGSTVARTISQPPTTNSFKMQWYNSLCDNTPWYILILVHVFHVIRVIPTVAAIIWIVDFHIFPTFCFAIF